MGKLGLDDIPHALVVPSRGHGHVNCAMLLSQSLAFLGFKVTFVYFSAHYSSLSQRNRLVLPSPELRGHHFPSSQPSAFASVCGHDCCSPAQVTPATEEDNGGKGKIDVHVLEDGRRPDEVDKSFFVNSVMKDNLFELIVELQKQFPPVVCLISDSFVPWTLEVAQRGGIPRIELWTSNAFAHQLVTSCAILFEDGTFPEKGPRNQWKSDTPLMLEHVPGLPPFRSELYPNEMRFGDSSDDFNKFFFQVGLCVKPGHTILINTLSELEPAAFKAFEVQGIPAYGIGPLPTQLETEDNDKAGCLSWLSSQAESSVIYVAFGSVFSLSREEIQELAMGLEASGSPFLWVLREDVVKMEELSQVLPSGFLERTGRTGMIIDWAPQPAVLAHKSVGGFLSHCGWNSTVESMWAGVPMLCCPRGAEQRLNCEYLCESWGPGLELQRTESGGLERSFVEAGVKSLMLNEEGRKARSKAQEIKQLIQRTSQPGGQSFSNLQKLYDDMKALAAKQSLRSFPR